jgi:hypothetical protein
LVCIIANQHYVNKQIIKCFNITRWFTVAIPRAKLAILLQPNQHYFVFITFNLHQQMIHTPSEELDDAFHCSTRRQPNYIISKFAATLPPSFEKAFL